MGIVSLSLFFGIVSITERSIGNGDKCSWNHYVLFPPSVLQGLLNDCNSMSAEYLFQPDKHYDVGHDTGDKVIQCGRHNDIFKFWLMWRAKGMSGMEAQVERLMALRKYQVF